MRLPASEKLEIIRLVEQSHTPARRTLKMLGIKPSTFYRWYDRYRSSGPEALEDKPSKPDRVWNRIPDDIRQRVVMMAFDQPELSPRELATRFTDTNSYYVSESSVYRLLKAHDLIGSPAFIVIKAADEFRDKTTAPNQLWQTDFTYLKVIGWGWYYLSTILAPNIRKNRKVSGSAYGSPSFAPINPDAHKMTNKPGAAPIVNRSIGEIAVSELSDVMR